MKRIINLAALAGLITFNLLKVNAQTNTTSGFRTNVLLNVSFALDSYIQGGTFIGTNRVIGTTRQGKIVTADIINALGTELGQGTNTLRGAKLLLRTTDLGTTNQVSAFVLRLGTNDTDVSSYLRFNFAGRSVNTERFNPRNGTTNSLVYAIMQFTLLTRNGSFSLQGFAKLVESSILIKKQIISSPPFPISIRAAVAGSGSSGNLPAVYRGNVTLSRRTVEIEQVSSP